MVTSVFFNQFNSRAEQKLIEDLVTESIKIYGHDVYYIPRTVFNADEVLNEPGYYAFRDALQIEMYIKNVDSFEGDGQFLQKFGLEIRDQMTLVVSRKIFDQDVLQYANIIRPREGDLIYLPMLEQCYQIKFVDNDAIFYQMGSLQTFEITCELFEYSNEIFNTGVDEIDGLYNAYLSNLNNRMGAFYQNDIDHALTTEDGLEMMTESQIIIMYDALNENSEFQAFADNNEIKIDSQNIIDFSEKSPFGDW